MELTPETQVEQWAPEDIEDELGGSEPELLKYIQLLPPELQSRHFQKLEAIKRRYQGERDEAVAEQRINYILGILEAREQAIEEFEIGEPALRDRVSSLPNEREFGNQLRETLLSQGNFLGAGITARVKSMRVEGFDKPIAVKYLLTPTAKTLSAQGEYDMNRELTTMIQIEDAEVRLGAGEHIRIPHPFFYYKRGKFQCYGMSQVNGFHLEEVLQGASRSTHSVVEALRARFASDEARKQLQAEVDLFMRAVHEVCLHGDIKLKNIMVDEQGMLYLIDFGQSVAVDTMLEETRDQFENIQDLEREQMQECIRALFSHLRNEA
jgi:hypothetical protein